MSTMISKSRQSPRGATQTALFCPCGTQLIKWHNTGEIPRGIYPAQRLACGKCGNVASHGAWSSRMTRHARYTKA